jgi:Mlc titration factor MtfA (ptsG expression regulator)
MFPWPFGKGGRRARLRRGALEARARAVFATRLRFWPTLSTDEQRELEGHVRVLLVEKRFEGGSGFDVDDETKWLVAAQAARMLLHRDTDYFPCVRSIVIYPKAFLTPVRRALDGGAVLEDVEERAGESWSWGTILLAKDEIELGLREGALDGYNVVLHEFAHALDWENGAEDGMPLLGSAAAERRWAEAFRPAYEALCEAVDRDDDPDTFLDPYGAESPAEFFAVTVESFFESPRELRDAEPAVYAALVDYFRQDPARALERVRTDGAARVRRAKARRPRLR